MPKRKKIDEHKGAVLAAAQAAIRKSGRPQSAVKILSAINALFPDINTSEDELEELLDLESRNESASIRRNLQGRLKQYFYGSGDNSVVDEKEHSLYRPFCALLEERGCTARTLDHTKARKGQSGENHWRYPDIVAFRPAVRDSSVAGLATKTGAFNEDTVIAYELKLEISAGSIRPAFFECLSNSFWANERYVAALEISTDANNVFRSLCRRYPVGLIEIETGKLGELTALKILVDCPRGTLDVQALDELQSDWEDLSDFLKSIRT